ncbi:hypothetical protein PRIC1_005175 [Phytophthora ramorum]|uniref:uncharacterized protein n=1 Tax=Phytophthora ramorum TaxID=164328 RepID=UPI003098D675|nr:hypothetical protein KRP23_9362 [Phytophthora ramorum]KAH7510404.1 hypothetical protein KRP22_1894 [Phytophthora ramorum]
MALTRNPAATESSTSMLQPADHSPSRYQALAAGTRSSARAAHRVRLCYRDEAYRQRSEARAKCLIADAASPTSSSTSVLLAKKALKYRKVYDRMTGVDVNDPNFDVFEFLGVDWCKTEASSHV